MPTKKRARRKTLLSLIHSKGYSLRTLGEKLGLHYSYLAHVAAGRRELRLDRAAVIAKVLGVSIDEMQRAIQRSQ